MLVTSVRPFPVATRTGSPPLNSTGAIPHRPLPGPLLGGREPRQRAKSVQEKAEFSGPTLGTQGPQAEDPAPQQHRSSSR